MTYNEDGTITLNKSELIAAGSLIENIENIDFSEEKIDVFAEGMTYVSILLFSMLDYVKKVVEERAENFEDSLNDYMGEEITS